ncbi:DNA-binding Lrp family transcriptional regulator [Rhizobium mongolense]
MIELDRIDVALLEAVQKNNRLSSQELAEEVHLSPTACQRRLKRLRNEGVIEADVSIISQCSLMGSMVNGSKRRPRT